MNALELRAVSGTGQDGETVCGLDASFAPGRFHVLRGPDGCGKNLLLRWLGLLQPPEAGEVLVQGSATRALSEEARAELRTQRFGFVFAAPFLLTSFSVIENVAMPLFKVSQVTPEEARRRTEALLGFCRAWRKRRNARWRNCRRARSTRWPWRAGWSMSLPF